MDKTDIQLLIDYNYWANARTLHCAARLTPAQFLTAPAAFSYGSLRGTLVHIYDAEYSWRSMCQHGAFTPDVKESDLPTFDGLQTR